MKKKYLILSLIIVIIIVIIFIVAIALKNKNNEDDSTDSVDYSNYDVVASIMADKTEVKPGDELTVRLSIDKMPDNGLGIRGINARIAYDPNKLTIEQTIDEYGETCDYIVPGELGKDMNLRIGTAGVVTDVEAGYVPNKDYAHKVIGIGVINDYSSRILGDVVEIKFRVNEGATGNLRMFVYPDDPKFSGFNVVGVIRNNDIMVTDDTTTFYLNTNIEKIRVQ